MMDLGNGGVIGALVTAILSIGWWVRKQKPGIALDDKVVAAAQADVGIIQRLEKEANRLADQNNILAEQLNRLQLELMKLSTENAKLHLEIVGLREENSDLRKELKELTEVLFNMNKRQGGGDDKGESN